MYILREFEIVIPSLREVTEDIPVLADVFLKMYAKKTEQSAKRLDASAIKALKQHLWIGNVRELKNVIIQAAFGTDSDVIASSDLTFNVSDPEDYEDVHLKNPFDEKRRITDALKRTDWNKTQAARLLNISRPTLDYKIKQFGIRKNEV